MTQMIQNSGSGDGCLHGKIIRALIKAPKAGILAAKSAK